MTDLEHDGGRMPPQVQELAPSERLRLAVDAELEDDVRCRVEQYEHRLRAIIPMRHGAVVALDIDMLRVRVADDAELRSIAGQFVRSLKSGKRRGMEVLCG